MAVPLDALAPDHLQHAVLAERHREAAFIGAECIVRGARADAPLLVRGAEVVDSGAREALERRRCDAASDWRWWGAAVASLLERDGSLLAAGAHDRVPRGGFLLLPLTPVLVVLAGASSRSRERCLAYLEAQRSLIADAIQAAERAQRQVDPAALVQLRSFARAHGVLARALARRDAPRAGLPSSQVRGLETWSGLPPSPAPSCTASEKDTA